MQSSSRESLAAAQARLDAIVGETHSGPSSVLAGGLAVVARVLGRDVPNPSPSEPGQRLTALGEGLFAVTRLLSRQSRLRRALSDPSADDDRKVALLDSLLARQLGTDELELLRDVVRMRWSRAGDLVDAVEILGAQALLTVALDNGTLDEVEDELFRFGRILGREPALRSALTDYGVPSERRVALLRSLLSGKSSPVTVRLLETAVEEPRGRTLDRAIESFSELAASRRSRVVAVVRVSRPLTETQLAALGREVSAVYGRQIDLQVEVDPSVLGGAVVRVGDEVVDGSIARRLDDARRRLAG